MATSRGMNTAVLALLAATRVPRLKLLVSVPALSLNLTNIPRSVTFGGVVYQGARDGAHKFNVSAQGIGENITFESPSATLKFDCLDGFFQLSSYQDLIRDTECTIQIVYVNSSGALTSLPWSTTFRCDADASSANEVTVRLACVDVVQGQELPKRTTQETGCQVLFMGPDCGFRWISTMATVLLQCDLGYETVNGCKAHFQPVIDPVTLLKTEQPKPYSAFPGGIDHRLVRGGR